MSQHKEASIQPNAGTPPMEVVLARPRGFCAGVDRAIAIVDRALERFGAPVYVKHAIVHNKHVVERLQARGAVFVEELEDVPAGARVIFSAHGVPPSAHDEAARGGMEVIDATCPLVTKVHLEARRFAAEGRSIFLIGHAGHVEVTGTQGEAPEKIRVVGSAEEVAALAPEDPTNVAFLTQTTLSMDDTSAVVGALRERFPALAGPAKADICYATQNRQNAVQALARECDFVLVVGSANSSNSNRLVEVAASRGVKAQLIESAGAIDPAWLHGVRRVGLSAGASAPEDVVQGVVEYLRAEHGATVRELVAVEENVTFPLPAALK